MSNEDVSANSSNEGFSPCNTLVLVDDENSILKALERLLLEEDYEVVCFVHAEDAFLYCQRSEEHTSELQSRL